ncbi:MAG: threonine--tRNA ligase [Candidatus Levybacteria bacterium]|nr:threonine--tRNA ligase [Candidatus Levybacteria bacterium]
MDEQSQLKDHKQIGREQELFFTHDYAPGAPFWLPNGMVIFKELEKYIRELTHAAGYQETSTPIMVKSQLFKESGHWTKFGKGFDEMYNLSVWEESEAEAVGKAMEKAETRDAIVKEIGKIENRQPFLYPLIVDGQTADVYVLPTNTGDSFNYALPVNYSLKPMNCPESTILYRFKTRSYKDLPIRLSEIGRLHRREKSGEVNGLLRVRQLTMDDAHIYAREDQIFDEVSSILDMMTKFYESFGFSYEFRFATRPETRAGTDEMWDKAEKDLEDVLKKRGIKAGDKKGDGAFYGPKIDLHIKDSLGREWQLATVQLDFHQPEAFKLAYVDEEGKDVRPVMIHRAIFGSFERFIGILTEHTQGAFPVWLSPVQVTILPIADRHYDYAQKVAEQIQEAGIRVVINNKHETLQAKIREATLQKVPFMGIIGDKEIAANAISVRLRTGEDQGSLEISHFLQMVRENIDKKK